MEIWKDAVGYEGLYKVSNMGNVLSCKRIVEDKRLGTKQLPERLLKLTVDTAGYAKVTLYKGTVKQVWKVHRLVAFHFCEKAEGCDIVNHIDNNTTNNVSSNLEWTTSLGNNRHMMNQGRNRNVRGEDCSWTNLTEKDIIQIRKLCSEGKIPQTQIGEQFGISQQQVSKINVGLRWAHVVDGP